MSGTEAPQQLRPILKGIHTVESTGKTVWEGVWCMREADLDNKAYTAPFRYERTGTYQKDWEQNDTSAGSEADGGSPQIQDGLYSGYFEIKSTHGPATTTRRTEKDVLIQFVSKNDAGVWTVEGSGANKLGKFTLKGTFSTATNEMTVVREYAIKKKKPTSKSRAQARVQRELGLLGANNPVVTPQGAVSDEVTATAGDGAPSRNAKALLGKLASVLDTLMEADTQQWFCAPVNAAALGLRDYHDIIDRPMDLGTVKKRYANNEYQTPQGMRDDILLTFGNAIHYNSRGNQVYKRAVELQDMFTSRYELLLKAAMASEISTPDAPPSFKRIGKRHSIPKIHFEPDPDSKYHADSTHRNSHLSPTSQESEDDRDSGSDVAPSRKRRKRSFQQAAPSPRSTGGDSDELAKLRKQVQEMSRHIAKLGSAMAAGAGLPAVPGQGMAMAPKAKPAKQASFEVKRKLGHDIRLLPGEKLMRVVEIIEENGFELPVNEATGEAELDLDLLDYGTIQKLRKYVSRHVTSMVSGGSNLVF